MRAMPVSLPRLLLAAVLLLAGSVAGAADVAGTWVMDTAALRDDFRRLMEADAAGMPADQRAQMEAVMPGRLDQMVHRAARTAHFRPDGTVLLEDFQGHQETGRWALEGERLRVLVEDEPVYTGTLAGDVMHLQAEEDGGSVRYVLKRQ